VVVQRNLARNHDEGCGRTGRFTKILWTSLPPAPRTHEEITFRRPCQKKVSRVHSC
jgi:hypothetical protein